MFLLSFRKSLDERHKGCHNAEVESKGFKVEDLKDLGARLLAVVQQTPSRM